MAFKTLQEGKTTFQAMAQADIRIGDLVKCMSVAAVATTTAYQSQLQVGSCALAADAVLCNGIAIGSAKSGDIVGVAQDGVYFMMSGGDCLAGTHIAVSLDPAAVIPATTTNAGSIIGRALSTGASGEQVVVNLNV
jgi:hypothetical protein